MARCEQAKRKRLRLHLESKTPAEQPSPEVCSIPTLSFLANFVNSSCVLCGKTKVTVTIHLIVFARRFIALADADGQGSSSIRFRSRTGFRTFYGSDREGAGHQQTLVLPPWIPRWGIGALICQIAAVSTFVI